MTPYPLPRPVRLPGLPLPLLLCGLAAGVQTLWLSGGASAAWPGQLLLTLSATLAAVLTGQAARHHAGAERRAWGWVTLGLLTLPLGELLRHVTLRLGPSGLWHSAADLSHLAWLPALLLAGLHFPQARLSRGTRTRLLLDTLVLVGAGGLWVWQGLLGADLRLWEQPLAGLLRGLRPLLDVALLGLLVATALRRAAPRPLQLGGVGLLLWVGADLGTFWLEARGGPLRGVLGAWGAVLFAAAARSSLRPAPAPSFQPLTPLALYGALLSCVGLAIWADRVGAPGAVPAILQVTQLMLLLVAARQTLVWRDRERLERELLRLNDTLEARVLERGAQVRRTFEGGLLALGVALETRDLETSGHTERVVRLARALGAALGLDERDLAALVQGAYLHDLGKLAIPDAILHKPGRLTPEEFALMKTHTTRGHEVATRLPNLTPGALDVVLHHHERWDGSGYPFGLAGGDIPLLARIFAVCDVYDALVSERPYKAAWTPEAALDEILASAGCHFDPRVAQVFAALEPSRRLMCGPGEVPAADPLELPDEQVHSLQEALNYAEAVIEVSRLTTSELDLPDLAGELLRVIAATCVLDWGGLVLIEGDTARVHALAPGPAAPAASSGPPEELFGRHEGVLWQTLQHEGPLFVDDYPAHPEAVAAFVERGVGAVAWLPLTVDAPRTVVLTVIRRSPAPGWSAQDRRLLETGARSARAALERRAHLHRLEKAALRDPLTGLGNRRALDAHLEEALARGEAVGVMLLDVDGFKEINDRFGHARGDEVLRALALALRWNMRPEDVVYRLGGDEFVVVFQAAGSEPGSIRARVVAACAGVAAGGLPGLGVSIGIAHSSPDGQLAATLLRLADERMYRMKRERASAAAAPSRGRVCLR